MVTKIIVDGKQVYPVNNEEEITQIKSRIDELTYELKVLKDAYCGGVYCGLDFDDPYAQKLSFAEFDQYNNDARNEYENDKKIELCIKENNAELVLLNKRLSEFT